LKLSGQYISSSEQDTAKWAGEFSELLNPGDIVFLVGSLGVGKTVAARGISRGLGYVGIVNSPSFTLLKTYEGKQRIIHCDLYRLQPEDDIRDLGIEEFLDEDCISLFEWSEKFPFAEKNSHFEVTIKLGSHDEERLISWRYVGQR